MADYFFGSYTVGGKVTYEELLTAMELFFDLKRADLINQKVDLFLQGVEKGMTRRLDTSFDTGNRRVEFLSHDRLLVFSADDLAFGRHEQFETYLALNKIDADGGHGGYYEIGGESIFIRNGEIFVIQEDRNGNIAIPVDVWENILSAIKENNCADALKYVNDYDLDTLEVEPLGPFEFIDDK